MKNLMESEALLSSNIFHTNPLNFPKVQTAVQTVLCNPRGPNLAVLVFSICSFHLWHSLSYSP